jgi:TonB family protein
LAWLVAEPEMKGLSFALKNLLVASSQKDAIFVFVKKDKHKYHSIRKPNLLGGKIAFQKFLDENLKYPQQALENKAEGTAHVKCEIDDRGRVLNAKSIHQLGYGLDEEAERLCLLMHFENTTERGLKIKHTRTVKIPFVLPKQNTVTITYETKPSGNKGGSYNYTVNL